MASTVGSRTTNASGLAVRAEQTIELTRHLRRLIRAGRSPHGTRSGSMPTLFTDWRDSVTAILDDQKHERGFMVDRRPKYSAAVLQARWPASLAASPGPGWANWGFILGLVCIGVAHLAGIGMRVAAASGAVLLVVMWSASFRPQDDLFLRHSGRGPRFVKIVARSVNSYCTPGVVMIT